MAEKKGRKARTTKKAPRTKPNNPTRARKWIPAFLRSLAKEPNVTVACEMASVGRTVVYEHRELNAEFAKEWDDAIAEGCDFMESEAYRRAVKGVDKPVYQMGMKVGLVREYSDTLMCLLLKAHKPSKYRERQSVEMSGPDGGALPVQIYIPSNGRD